MRLHIAHSTVYHYDPPASGAIQLLRLTPRNHDGQYVVRWRIDVSPDARLSMREDAFGNMTHVFSATGPFNQLSVAVDGESKRTAPMAWSAARWSGFRRACFCARRS